jgi:hypothetical protein
MTRVISHALTLEAAAQAGNPDANPEERKVEGNSLKTQF